VQAAVYGTARLGENAYGYAGLSIEARNGLTVAGGSLGVKVEF
jgi:hypothetical protein